MTFNEQDHPRADDGKFTNKDGGGNSSTDKSNYSDDVSTPEKKAQWLRNRIDDLKQKNKENPSSELKSWIKDYETELNELEGTKPTKLSLKERFARYMNEGIGAGENEDYWNDEIADIESQMKFKDDAEQEKWEEMGASYMGEPEFERFTNEILSRSEVEQPKEKSAAEKLGVKSNPKSTEVSANDPRKLAKKMEVEPKSFSKFGKDDNVKQKLDNYVTELNEIDPPDNVGEIKRREYIKEFYEKTNGNREEYINRNISRFGLENSKGMRKFLGEEFDKVDNYVKGEGKLDKNNYIIERATSNKRKEDNVKSKNKNLPKLSEYFVEKLKSSKDIVSDANSIVEDIANSYEMSKPLAALYFTNKTGINVWNKERKDAQELPF